MKNDKTAIATVYVADHPQDNFGPSSGYPLRNKIQYVLYARDLFARGETVNKLRTLIRVTNFAETISEAHGLPVKVVIRWTKIK